MHGDYSCRREPVTQPAELIGSVHIERPARGSSYFLVPQKGGKECAGGWIQYGKIQPEFAHALVEQLGEHSRGAIPGILSRDSPPTRLQHTTLAALRRRQP